mgnify:CR=1 FL=1
MKNLYTKLLAIQSEIKAQKKDEPNPFYKSKYFTVDSLIAGLRPILTKHGVIVIQPITNQDGKNVLSTEVMDAESGDRLTACMILPDIADCQKLGAAITYFRRYALTSLFLIEGEADDDGNTASTATTSPRAVQHATESAGLGSRLCCDCDKPYTPKAGTEAYSKKCYPCFAKNGKDPIDKSAKPMPISPVTAQVDDGKQPFEQPVIDEDEQDLPF